MGSRAERGHFMKLRLPLLLGATLLVLGIIAAACDGDERLTLEEFFQQGQAIDDDFEERFERLFDDFPDEDDDEFFSNEENLPLYKGTFVQFPVIFGEFFDELETLNPPSEAEDAFDELLTSGREVVEAQEGALIRIEEAESFAEVERITDEFDAENQAVQERYQAACQSLQEIADDNGIVANIDCAEGE